MVKAKIYVEGGGNDNKNLRTECRKGFSKLLEKAGFKGMMPQFVACGSRLNAFEMFCNGISSNRKELSFLLVDSEEALEDGEEKWAFLKRREGDKWDKPEGATEDHVFLMVQVMETWLVADRETLSRYYGQNFQESALLKRADLENVSKAEINRTLKIATKNTQKGEYSKGRHSFEILSEIAPSALENLLHAQDFFDILREQLGGS